MKQEAMCSSMGRWLPAMALFMIMLMSSTTVAAQVVATPVTKSFGDSIDYYMLVFNNTPRALNVTVDFAYTCADGRSGKDSVWFPSVNGSSSSESPLRSCFPQTAKQVGVLNKRWQLANHELEYDAAKAAAAARAEEIRRSEAAMAEESRRKEERRKRVRCNIDDSGRFELEKVAFGRVPRECHEWFPEMHTAIQRHEAAERQHREEGQKRLRETYRQHELSKEQRQMQAMREKLEAAQRQDAQDRMRQQKASVQAQDAARAQQAALERDAAEKNGRARAYQSDPCGAVADMRSRAPQVRPYPSGATVQVRMQTDRYNTQLHAQWQHALAAQERACASAGTARPAALPTARPSPSAEAQQLAQEAQRQQKLQAAREDLERVNAEGRETLRMEQQRNQAVKDENALLRDLMDRMK